MFDETNKSLLCQYYLEHVYQRVSTLAATNTQNVHSIAESYGEVLPSSISKIITLFDWQESDVFYDLGSGVGKIAIQFFLLTNIKKIYGIEIRPDFHHQAEQAEKIIRHELPNFFTENRELNFLLGSFLEIPISHATILFISATCFDPSLIKSISLLVNTLKQVHTIITFRPLPYLKNLRLKKTFSIECSWDTTLCYVYQSS